MIKVLQTLGLQGTYLKIITIYSTPTVNTVLSGENVKPFTLKSEQNEDIHSF